MGQPWNQADLLSVTDALRKVVKVQCRSGYIYAVRPESFIYLNHEYEVERIERQWREPGETHFAVITRDRKSFELCYNDHKDKWYLE